ncbi:thiamine pyrophosphokinase Thi80 [Gloeopeniophorella convolvens]|nr:thiamine pyrophosphokinase Thi80 [Gloeopeniophorella convolvens]
MSSETQTWTIPFLQSTSHGNASKSRIALIILNQPFSRPLLRRLWQNSDWHCCADGGANRLYDTLDTSDRPTGWLGRIATWLTRPRRMEVDDYLPDLIKGDLDSLRDDVRRFYKTRDVSIVRDRDEYSTDLMKCVESLQEKEKADGVENPYDIVLLGGLSGRLDQTVHTLSYLHKIRKSGRRIFAVTDDNVGWVLDEGKHAISIDHTLLGQTCGLLPVGVDSTVLTTTGLKWNLTNAVSGFGGQISTSNHLVPGEDTVYIETSRPIWWVVELRRESLE